MVLGVATDAVGNQFSSLGLRMGGSEVASRRIECANGKLANTVKEAGRARGGEPGKRDRQVQRKWVVGGQHTA